jgi:hypothetical protein
MEELTDEEIEFLKRAIILIENKQLSNLLQGLVVREVDIIAKIGNDEELRESSLWNIAALCSAIMQLRPGGWAFEDLEFEPIQVDTSSIQDQTETPETQISEDQPEHSQNPEE